MQLMETDRKPTQTSQITRAITQSLLEKSSSLPVKAAALHVPVVRRHQSHRHLPTDMKLCAQ